MEIIYDVKTVVLKSIYMNNDSRPNRIILLITRKFIHSFNSKPIY